MHSLKKMRSYLLYGTEAFTLIELMVVVGIIGLLAMIAIPAFSRYQAKARQSEAKIGLGGVFTAEKSFMSEYSAYVSSMNAIGYSPEGQKRNYDVGFADNTTNAPTYAFIGFLGETDIPDYASINNTMTCTGSADTLGSLTAVDGQSFNAAATGCIINQGGNFDTWTMDDQKHLSNVTTGY